MIRLEIAFDGETAAGVRCVALDMAAFRTWAKGGLIPQAKQGAKGVCTLAVVGSKFEGTGFEKEHIGQIHVPVVMGAGAALGNRKGESPRAIGLAVALLEGVLRPDRLRFCTEDRLDGFGTRVILEEDLRKP